MSNVAPARGTITARQQDAGAAAHLRASEPLPPDGVPPEDPAKAVADVGLAADADAWQRTPFVYVVTEGTVTGVVAIDALPGRALELEAVLGVGP